MLAEGLMLIYYLKGFKMAEKDTTLINLRAKMAELDYKLKMARAAVKAGSCGEALTTMCNISTMERERRTVNKQLIEAEIEIKELNRIYPRSKK